MAQVSFAEEAARAALPYTSNPINETRVAAAQVLATLALAASVSELAAALKDRG